MLKTTGYLRYPQGEGLVPHSDYYRPDYSNKGVGDGQKSGKRRLRRSRRIQGR